MAGIGSDEFAGDVGTPDVDVVRMIRELFLRDEPLVIETAFDSTLSPRELRVALGDGIGDAETASMDVTWYTTGRTRFTTRTRQQ